MASEVEFMFIFLAKLTNLQLRICSFIHIKNIISYSAEPPTFDISTLATDLPKSTAELIS